MSITQCNYPGCSCSNQFRHEVDDRLAKGFTVYQTYFDSAESDGGGQRGVSPEPSMWKVRHTLVDPTVFTEVTVNDVVNPGEQNSVNPALKDYGIEMATTDDRPKVNYVNKVEDLKNLTFTKELYRKHDADTEPVKVNPDGSLIGEGVPRSQQAADEETFDFRLYFLDFGVLVY